MDGRLLSGVGHQHSRFRRYRTGRSARRPFAVVCDVVASDALRPRRKPQMRCADRRRRHHRIAGRRTADAAGARCRHRRSRVARSRQHGGFHVDVAVGNRPAVARTERSLRLRACRTRLSRQPRCGRRPEIAGLAARHHLRHARQEFTVSCGGGNQRQPDRRTSLAGAGRTARRFSRPHRVARKLSASLGPVRLCRRARPMQIP